MFWFKALEILRICFNLIRRYSSCSTLEGCRDCFGFKELSFVRKHYRSFEGQVGTLAEVVVQGTHREKHRSLDMLVVVVAVLGMERMAARTVEVVV